MSSVIGIRASAWFLGRTATLPRFSDDHPSRPEAGSRPVRANFHHLPGRYHALLVHVPAGCMQKLCDPGVAISAIDFGQFDDVGGELRLIIGRDRWAALRRALLAQNFADAALAEMLSGERRLHLINTAPAAGRAQKFPFAASLRIILSIVRSATAFLSLEFSSSSSFRHRTWSSCRPPYSFLQR